MRIWVARPEPGATRTGGRLIGLGHDPLVAPVLVVASNTAPPPAGPFAGILLTSANAVPALAALRATRKAMLETPVFAVGSSTAAAAAGTGAAVCDAEGDAADLAGLVQTTLPRGSVLLHLAGADKKREPAASLEAAGYRVVPFVAYEARPLAGLPAAIMSALDETDAGSGLDAALHYSRRSAATALDLAVAAGRGGAFGALRHYCLSADVAAPLVAAGIEVHFVPARPSEDALLAGLGTRA